MTEPLLPEKLEELMAGYALGNLSPEEAEELRQLVAEHPELNAEVHELQQVLELMPYALPEATPPPHQRENILKVVEAENSNTSLPQQNIKKFPLRWSHTIASVAAVLALAVGLDNYRLRQNITSLQAQTARQKDVIAMLQDSNTHLVSLKGMDSASAATGNILMTPGEPKAVVVLQNLPVLPQGKFYYLWAVVDGKKIPAGQFNANEKGNVFVKLPIPANSGLTALVVTLEVSPAPKNPSGIMVMTSNI